MVVRETTSEQVESAGSSAVALLVVLLVHALQAASASQTAYGACASLKENEEQPSGQTVVKVGKPWSGIVKNK